MRTVFGVPIWEKRLRIAERWPGWSEQGSALDKWIVCRFIVELPIWGVMQGGHSPTGVTPHIGGQFHAAIASGRLSKYAWSGVRAPRLECGLLPL